MPEDRRRFLVDITCEDQAFQRYMKEPDWLSFFETVLEKVFSYLSIPAHDISLSILLTNDAKMKELNNQFRGKNKPTNVLSFPSGDPLDEGVGFLGDMAFGIETIESEHPDFMSHMTHLAIHGILHLVGFDHETDEEAEEMEACEVEILELFNIPNPYRDL